MARPLTLLRSARLWAALGLVVGVVALHVVVADRIAAQLGPLDRGEAEVHRLQVAYVREMPFTPPVARAAPVQPKRRTVEPPAPGASQVEPTPVAAAPSEPAPAEPVVPPEPAASAVAAVASAASGVEATPFEWPVSTRMRYVLTGHVRGEVHGQAQVEWIRAGDRYQVHLDVQVGPSFAPLATRRMSSDGEITADGLVPRRYEQETQLAFDGPYRALMRFDGERVWLANGRTVQQVPGIQDTASQFVQLAYLFDRQPDRLRVGEVVEVWLAMPRNVSAWTYDVVAQETLYTPFGEVPTFHLKPRREPKAGGDLVTELWIAPQLRHLPVRFRIRQDTENHVDLMLDRRPELAAPERLAPTRP
ncbi:MAG: DUF3108 domain-containing protein [Rhizobacter sp.]